MLVFPDAISGLRWYSRARFWGARASHGGGLTALAEVELGTRWAQLRVEGVHRPAHARTRTHTREQYKMTIWY